MQTVHDLVSERFLRWDKRGRGWEVHDQPVLPEPAFVAFPGAIQESPCVDDARRPTILSALVQRLSKGLGAEPAPLPEESLVVESEPECFTRDSLVELEACLPREVGVSRELFEQFVSSLVFCRDPIAMELVATALGVVVQLATSEVDADLVRRQSHMYFPEVTFKQDQTRLADAWHTSTASEAIIVDFGLAREFMFPLAAGKVDPYVGIIGAQSELKSEEMAVFQVLFQPVSHPWSDNILRSVSRADRRPFFVNIPELKGAAEEKVRKPLYAVVIRIGTKAATFERALEISRGMAGALGAFGHPSGNELIPLDNSDYPFDAHVEDFLLRQTRRSGMLLNRDELVSLVHFPSSDIRSPALLRQTLRTKAPPAMTLQPGGVLLGHNIHQSASVPVRLSAEHRVRHTHIVGASGTGKSTLLFNLIRQDIEQGQGVAVLDPHGDLVDRILSVIPPGRIDDVVLVDPSDEEYSIGFNILHAHTDLEKALLASDLVSLFQRLSSSWGDQLQSVLQNAVLAFLESNRGGTLADLRRFLIEPAFRAEFLTTVSDPNVLYYWNKGFAHLSGNKSIGSILTRLEMFLSKKPIYLMVAQCESKLDFGSIMDTGKIFLAKLPEGLLGKENSHLLGAVLISKFQQLVMSRQAKQIAARRDFWIYIDEFHNFITPSMTEILSGARKYRIGLTLAHHELRQLQRDSEVASAVLSHPCTRICFRLGDEDSRKLSDGFSFFEARDLQNLGVGEAIARIERSDFDFNLSVPPPKESEREGAIERRDQIVTASRKKYGTARSVVEDNLQQAWSEQPTPRVSKKESVIARSPVSSSPLIDLGYVTAPPVPNIGVADTSAARQTKTKLEPAQARHEAGASRDLGRGGEQHQAIQRRIKEAAEKLGFRGTIESICVGGSVDLVLERDGQNIACEISLTTTIDHEVGNVVKCVKAGFKRIAVVCVEDARLKKISAAVKGSLGAEGAKCVEYYQPDQFLEALRAIERSVPVASETVVERRGYKVKRSTSALSEEERRRRESEAIRVIAESMHQANQS